MLKYQVEAIGLGRQNGALRGTVIPLAGAPASLGRSSWHFCAARARIRSAIQPVAPPHGSAGCSPFSTLIRPTGQGAGFHSAAVILAPVGWLPEGEYNHTILRQTIHSSIV